MVKARREALGIGLRELARQIDHSPSLVHAFEAGTRTPDPETAERIADALSLDDHLRGAWLHWAQLRRPGSDAGKLLVAADRLLYFLSRHPDLTGRQGVPSHPGLTVRSAGGLAHVVGSPREVPGVREPGPERDAFVGEAILYKRARSHDDGQDEDDDLRAAEPVEPAESMLRIPLLPEGTTLERAGRAVGAAQAHHVLLDPVVVPPGETLRDAFAWRLSEAGVARISDLLGPGDTVVISLVPVPERFRSDQVWLVAWQRGLVLTRLVRKGGVLLLTAPAGSAEGVDVLALQDGERLEDVVRGKVVVALRTWA
jgi:transcriptional regulator with XRE-family HTH domain